MAHMLLGIYFSEAILPVGTKHSSVACDIKEYDLPLLVVQLSIIATAQLSGDLHDGRHSPEQKAEVYMRKIGVHGGSQFQLGNAAVDVFLLKCMDKPRNIFSPPFNSCYTYLLRYPLHQH